jgi:hypothetical protein
MSAPGLDILTVGRVARVFQAIKDARDKPADFAFSRRVPDVPATEGELLMRVFGRPQIADLVGDGAAAVEYRYGKSTFESFDVPNIKHGRGLNQEQINQLRVLAVNTGGIPGQDVENSPYAVQERNILASLLTGVRQRIEALKVAMVIDQGYSYNRLGIQMTGVTFGTPSDLKLTPSNPWTDHTNGDPVGDLLSTQYYARIKYGADYTRATMSTQALREAIQCVKFQNQAKLVLPTSLSITNLSINNLKQLQALFEAVSGFTIQLYDTVYWSQDEAGTEASGRYMPINLVVLDSPSNDGDPDIWNFGNVEVTESIIGSLFPVPGMVGRFNGPTRGPVAYATVPYHMNPPSVSYWAVARGWPRKINPYANAVLNVGTLTDIVPFGDPF